MDTPQGATLLIGAAILLSIAGLLLVRRCAGIEWLRRHHEMVSHFFVMIGTLYAVLIAFAIYVVWNGTKEAGTNVEHEATEVADLSRLSTAMPDPLRHDISVALMEYLRAVSEDEFPAMAQGRESERTWTAVQRLWDVYKNAEPDTPRLQAYFSESLRHLTALSDYRRTRLFASHGTVPRALWFFLITGGILLVVFSYFIGHESMWPQAVTSGALAGILAFDLFLILSFDAPYAGVTRVTPQPFRLELQHVAARMAR